MMSASDHLWPDPAPDIPWEVWSEDTFDREARPIRDRAGTGLVSGLKSLWVRFLLESVRPDGTKGFTRFYLRWRAGDSIRIQGQWEGAVRLRKWIFGQRRMTSRSRLEAINRQLFEAIVHTHAQMVLLGGTSEAILAAAAVATDQSEFGNRLERLTEPWGVRLNYTSLGKARSLDPLPLFKTKLHHRQVFRKEAVEKSGSRSEPGLTSRFKDFPRADYRLVGALAFLLIGLFFLAIFGQQVTLNCTRVETQEIDCIHQTSWFNLVIINERPLNGVWRARVQQVCDVNGCAIFPELDTEYGPVRLGNLASSGSVSIIDTVDETNLFLLNDQAEALTLTFESSKLKRIIPMLSILVGILFLVIWLRHWHMIRE